MGKKISEPTQGEEKLLDDIVENSVDYVEVRGKRWAVRWVRNRARRKVTDILLKEEDDFRSMADNDAFDIIIGDLYFKKALPHFHGTYIDFPHFAVSGRE